VPPDGSTSPEVSKHTTTTMTPTAVLQQVSTVGATTNSQSGTTQTATYLPSQGQGRRLQGWVIPTPVTVSLHLPRTELLTVMLMIATETLLQTDCGV